MIPSEIKESPQIATKTKSSPAAQDSKRAIGEPSPSPTGFIKIVEINGSPARDEMTWEGPAKGEQVITVKADYRWANFVRDSTTVSIGEATKSIGVNAPVNFNLSETRIDPLSLLSNLLIVRASLDGHEKSDKEIKFGHTIRVKVVDPVPPQLTIQPPEKDIPLSESLGSDVIVTGKAFDYLGIDRIEIESPPGFSPPGTSNADYNPTNTEWTKILHCPPNPGLIGKHTIKASCYDKAQNFTPKEITVEIVDQSPPKCKIEYPLDGFVVSPNSTISVHGTAEDSLSKIKEVRYSVDNSENLSLFKPVESTNNFQNWNVEIQIPTIGKHTIFVRAEDSYGIPDLKYVGVEVKAEQFEPENVEDLLGTREYLKNLLSFATKQISIASNTSATSEKLEQTFYQNFNTLTNPVNKWADQQMSQLRLSIEVLRNYAIAILKQDFDFKTIESNYLQLAYQTMLTTIGISYEEVRLVHGSDIDKRKSLAIRLGINPEKPELLDSLFIEPNQITGTKLEELFGLVDINRNPSEEISNPKLLKWQLEHLDNVWMIQDHLQEQNSGDDSTPGSQVATDLKVIIDPDLIGEDDLGSATKGNQAYDLLEIRMDWIKKQFELIKNERESEKDPVAALRKIVNSAIIVVESSTSLCIDKKENPFDFLICLENQLKNGHNIEAALNAIFLDMEAFAYLLRIKLLTESKSGIVTPSEWDDVYNILVQAKKRQVSKSWREEEKIKKIALTPEYFKISPKQKEMINWRSTLQNRLAWEDTLQARIDQIWSVTQAFQTNIQSTEDATLPILRDELIDTIAARKKISSQALANELTQLLFIDMKTGSSQYTTRILQSIQTLQGILFSLRTGRLRTDHPASLWKINNERQFDERWAWIGSYGTWRAAMIVFLYCENILYPSLREEGDDRWNMSRGFRELVDALRETPYIDAEQARKQAEIFYSKVPPDVKKFLNDEVAKAPEDVKQTFLSGINFIFVITERDMTANKLRWLRKVIADFANNDLMVNHSVQYKEIFFFVPIQLAISLQKSAEFVAALDWYQMVYAYNLVHSERKIFFGLEQERNLTFSFLRWEEWVPKVNPHALAEARSHQDDPSQGFNPYTRFTLICLIRCFLEFADSEFTRSTFESISKARSLYLTALELLSLSDLSTPTLSKGLVSVSNPLLDMLRHRAENQLEKLRQGRTIAGLKRQLESYMPPKISPGGNLPIIGSGGQLIMPEITRVLTPTPYRYKTLIERSKQLVGIAQQIESAFLSALERSDTEAYGLVNAGFDLEISNANVDLQSARVNEAQGNVDLANKQRQRSVIQQTTYNEWINSGLNKWEENMISSYETARGAQISAAFFETGSQMAQSAISAAGIANPMVAAAVAPLVAANILMNQGKFLATSVAIDAQTNAQIASIKANYERSKETWELQKSIADQDIVISDQQILLAESHKGIVEKERSIAVTKSAQDKAIAEFIANKFTNKELYEWMSGVLSGVYRYFLQQATAIAQLAQNQIAFERQEPPPNFVIADYWQPPSSSADTTSANKPGGDKNPTDRRGLTGSARLLQNIYQLDQYAFETDKRKLNLTQTFSLSKLFPFEFQQFRENGILRFSTPMRIFDECFPGHYLRLIRKIRCSVVALIPPVQGIRASLIASGISKVVIGGDIFQNIVVTRDPEFVALTSPTNSSGIFEMDIQSDMLYPFEAMGVDTSWELQMPKAANAFNYGTISDVLITIEYTALNSLDYRQQVIQALDNRISGDIQFSFKERFPDGWYALLNPEQTDDEKKQMTIPFNVSKDDFPPNILNLKIEHIMLYFSLAQKIKQIEITARLAKGWTTTAEDEETSVGRIISTRRGRWPKLRNQKSLMGEWELSFRSDDELTFKQIKDRFKNSEIQDIICIVSYKGNSPEWPT